MLRRESVLAVLAGVQRNAYWPATPSAGGNDKTFPTSAFARHVL